MTTFTASRDALRERGHRGLRVPADGDGQIGPGSASPAPLPERAPPKPPQRSLEQRLDALKRANHVRVHRANLKRSLVAGSILPRTFLNDSDCESMKVIDFLLAIPKVGCVKANRALAIAQISPSKSLGGLSERQRNALLAMLPGHCDGGVITDAALPIAPIYRPAPRAPRPQPDRGTNELLADIGRA